MNNTTYDATNGMWLDKTKAPEYYALDWRGLPEPTEVIETQARVSFNGDVISRIELDNVPRNLRIPQEGTDEATNHQRVGAAMIEQERIIKLLEDNWPEDIPSKIDDYWSGYEAAIALIKGKTND